MAQMNLFFFPGACSRVTMTALEEIGAPYTKTFFHIMEKPQALLAENPTGKVPALRVDARLLTENAAILHHLNANFPDAGLLPKEARGLGFNEPLQDLVWCSSTLHPMTRMLRNPKRLTTGADIDGVMALGHQYWQPVLSQLAQRFDAGQWWYGDQWSIVDTYIFWNYNTSQGAGLDLSAYPSIARHAEDVRNRSTFQRVRAFEMATAKERGLQAPPGATL